MESSLLIFSTRITCDWIHLRFCPSSTPTAARTPYNLLRSLTGNLSFFPLGDRGTAPKCNNLISSKQASCKYYWPSLWYLNAFKTPLLLLTDRKLQITLIFCHWEWVSFSNRWVLWNMFNWMLKSYSNNSISTWRFWW